ncbi:MAG: hypothetical protein K2P75_10125 [Sphingobacteriaceae bacterium]|nr:hypothetical protein [Sphingobacteriaceae bacterium]
MEFIKLLFKPQKYSLYPDDGYTMMVIQLCDMTSLKKIGAFEIAPLEELPLLY